jgi:hypothetical protein
MQPTILDRLGALLHSFAGGALGYVFPAAVAVIVLWIVWRLFRRRKPVVVPLPPNLRVDIAALGDQSPPEGPPMLEFYNLPMRLAAIVLAPVGRGDCPNFRLSENGTVPFGPRSPDDQLAPLLDAIVPGLDQVAALHRPLVRRWPNQISARGFAHLFFNNAKLPGTAGKGTPWSSVAGMFKFQGKPVMAGLVLRAAKPNSLGQTIIDAEYQWLGCLRVRWS